MALWHWEKKKKKVGQVEVVASCRVFHMGWENSSNRSALPELDFSNVQPNITKRVVRC